MKFYGFLQTHQVGKEINLCVCKNEIVFHFAPLFVNSRKLNLLRKRRAPLFETGLYLSTRKYSERRKVQFITSQIINDLKPFFPLS